MDNKSAVKQYVKFAILYAAIFAIYNIIVLLAFTEKNNIFWISYGFMCAGFAVNIAITLYTFRSEIDAVFMGIPLLSFSIFYFFAELFVSVVFMLFKGFAGVTLTVSVQTILLLAFVIVAVVAMMTKDAVEGVNKAIEKNVRTIKNLSVDVKILEDQCMDKELKAELHKISEAIRYSDPMTTDAVAELDELITGKVKELKYHCNSNAKSEAMQICFQLSSFISERNQRLLLSK